MNYFGFTNKNNLNHSSSSTAGISMSEYTFKLLSEIRNAKFIITTDKNIDKLQSSEKKFYLRNSKYFSIIDTFIFLVNNYKELKYNQNIIYHSFLFLPLIFFFQYFQN